LNLEQTGTGLDLAQPACASYMLSAKQGGGMANENDALRIITAALGAQVRMDDDRRRLAQIDHDVALDILRALDAEGFEVVRKGRDIA
jgi:hypothetical protein